jgi:hypothetical protein
MLDEPSYSSLMGSTLTASCADVLEHELALWTFVERDKSLLRITTQRGGSLAATFVRDAE